MPFLYIIVRQADSTGRQAGRKHKQAGKEAYKVNVYLIIK